MSFWIYDVSFLIIFSLAVTLFLIKNKKNLKREGPMFLYKTKVGLEIMDNLAKKHPKLLKFLSYVIVVCGYILMIMMVYFLIQMVSIFLRPDLVKLIKIPPLMPLIPYLPKIFSITWLPPFYFTYWILALAIIALVHEGSHGVFARFYGVRIKSTGFGFLGPFLAFFVEQDDKQMTKKKIFPQLTILGAGVFANIIVGIIFLIIMIAFSSLTYAPAGAIFNDYSYYVANTSIMNYAIPLNQTLAVDGINLSKISIYNKTYFVSAGALNLTLEEINKGYLIKLYTDSPAINAGVKGVIIGINDDEIKTYNDANIYLSDLKPGDKITLITKNGNNIVEKYNITLAADYMNESRGIIGTAIIAQRYSSLGRIINFLGGNFRESYTYYEPKSNPELVIFIYNLFWWIVIINISVALSNMLPAFIFDGGRFWYLTVLAITKKEKIAKSVFKVFTWALLFFFIFLMLLWFKGMF